MLARLGADVIKIERLGGEEVRYHAPWVRKQSAYWVQYNVGKKSVSMDLRKEEGKEALRKLVQISDVLLQNFQPGTIAVSGDFWHFSRTPAIVGSTPHMGEHNKEVLGGLLWVTRRQR